MLKVYQIAEFFNVVTALEQWTRRYAEELNADGKYENIGIALLMLGAESQKMRLEFSRPPTPLPHPEDK